MQVRTMAALSAGVFLVACGSSGNANADSDGVAMAAAVAAAPSANWNDATLNAAKVDYFFASMDKFLAYKKANPDFDMDATSINSGETETDYAKRMNSDPQLRQLFTSTGVKPAHYANAAGVLMGAMLGAGLGANADQSKMPQAVRYYTAHKADIERRMAALQAKGEALAESAGDSDDGE